jgi:hypothetical protein
MRLQFWTALQAHEQKVGGLHADLKPGVYAWQGKRQEGLWWNFVVRQRDTRAELYIDFPNQARNKAIFDTLIAQRLQIEKDFEGPLDWQRMDSKRASRITVVFPGGWTEGATWNDVIPKVVTAMERLHKVIAKRAVAAKEAS